METMFSECPFEQIERYEMSRGSLLFWADRWMMGLESLVGENKFRTFEPVIEANRLGRQTQNRNGSGLDHKVNQS